MIIVVAVAARQNLTRARTHARTHARPFIRKVIRNNNAFFFSFDIDEEQRVGVNHHHPKKVWQQYSYYYILQYSSSLPYYSRHERSIIFFGRREDIWQHRSSDLFFVRRHTHTHARTHTLSCFYDWFWLIDWLIAIHFNSIFRYYFWVSFT